MDGNRRQARSPAKPGPLTRAILVVIVLVLIVAAAVAWWAIHMVQGSKAGGPGGPGGPGGGRGRPATTVGVAKAQTADMPITLDGLGTVTPAATVTVTPQVSGVITQILYREGQMVQKGQVLAVVDPRPLQMADNQALGQLARDQAQLANAKLLLTRDQTLLTQDSIAQQDVDTQAALVKQLEGTVVADDSLGWDRAAEPRFLAGHRAGQRAGSACAPSTLATSSAQARPRAWR